jgi:molybdate transport system ATP-binding protein
MPVLSPPVDPAPLKHGGSRGLHVSLRCTSPVPLQAEFDCAPGELVALVGPSGSGKTTLLRAIAGLFQSPHLQGHVTMGDGAGSAAWFDSAKGIHLSPQARRAGLVFQQYALFPHLSALDNIAVCADAGYSAAHKQSQASALLERMGLAALAQRLPHQLSGGQQQRVALARALVRLLPSPSLCAGQRAAPGVLLLDEPFSAVDAQLHASLQLPIVLVTHDLAEARRLADRIVIMDGGATLQSGPPEHLLRSPRNARVAQLVGIHNHFGGQFYRADSPSHTANTTNTVSMGRLRWGSVDLQVVDKEKIDTDTAVTWVVAGDGAQILAAMPQQPIATDNYLPCRLVEMLPLGEICLCRLTVDGAPAQEVVTLNVPSALLRSIQAHIASPLVLHLEAQALHIMPVRGNAEVA